MKLRHAWKKEGLANTCIVARITKRSFDTLNLKTGHPIWLQIKAMSLV